jgi:seryl-tRNA(Sec) selenium transferase
MAKQFIEQILDDAKQRGYDASIRDVSYAVLHHVLGNSLMAYTVVFGVPQTDSDITVYEDLDQNKYLARYIDKALAPKAPEKSDAEILKSIKAQNKVESEFNNITAEENKDAIIRRLGELKEMYDSKEISAKDYVKLDLEARVKLADKFDVVEESKQAVYLLPTTYNMICPHTRRECYQMTKEFAMKQFNLVER